MVESLASTSCTLISEQDVPDHIAGMTSSIGALWPPQKASFNRIKGFYTSSVLASPLQFEKFYQNFLDICARASSHPHETSRVSIRAVITRSTITSVRPLLERSLEAIIDLRGTPQFAGSALVYLGCNHESRASSSDELNSYRKNLATAKIVQPRTQKQLLQRAFNHQCSLRILEYETASPEQRTETLNQMADLYARFGWKKPDVENILENPDNIIAIAETKESIVSAGIAEMAKVKIGNAEMRMAEITEAATREEHICKGLYTAVSTFLIQEIATRSQRSKFLEGEVDFVYGECNGNALGVLKTAAIQGRTFATETTARYGFPHRGILHQHVPISGAPRTTPYNDLFPAYLTRQLVYQYAPCTT